MDISQKHIKRFETYLINEEKAVATVKKYVYDVQSFVVWLSGRKLSKTEVLLYKEYLIEHFAPASVNSAISSLNSFFTFNEWHSLKVKTLKIQRRIFTSEEKELTREEYGRLLSAAKSKGNERLYLLMQTICSTGIRVSELRYITVEALKTRRANINMKGKLRLVIIPLQLSKALLKYVKKENIKSGSVFVTRKGKPLDRSNIWSYMKKLCELARVAKEKVFPHNLRHLFARTFYSLQKDIVRLADILGHSSVNTTRIYTIESGEIHGRLIERLGLLQC